MRERESSNLHLITLLGFSAKGVRTGMALLCTSLQVIRYQSDQVVHRA